MEEQPVLFTADISPTPFSLFPFEPGLHCVNSVWPGTCDEDHSGLELTLGSYSVPGYIASTWAVTGIVPCKVALINQRREVSVFPFPRVSVSLVVA